MRAHDMADLPELSVPESCPKCRGEMRVEIGMGGDAYDQCVRTRCRYVREIVRRRGVPDGSRKAAPRTEAVFAFGGIA
jgi:ssDNA-binding Zn-finger/Zn-ribbon topoisomerase 1